MVSIWIVRLELRVIPEHHCDLIDIMGAFTTEKKAEQVAKKYNSHIGSHDFYGVVQEIELDKEREREDMREKPSDDVRHDRRF